MKFQLEEYHRNVSDDELLADLKRIAGELVKDSVTREEYDERGTFHSSTLVRRFGGWFKALEKAGLQRTRNFNITEEELFQDLEEAWTKLGRQPRYEEMHAPLSKYSSGTYENRFGTWRRALERFVAYVDTEETISSEESAKRLDVDPTTRHRTKRSINWRLRFLVMRRDHFKCKNCGRSPATDPKIILHVDHVRAWTNGGKTVLENLQTLCSKCNIGKSDLE